MLNPVLTILLLLIAVAIDVYVNWYLIERKKIRPNHYINWLIRAIFGIILAYKESMAEWFLEALTISFIYLFLFDLSLNLVRSKPFDYLGDAVIDKLVKKYSEPFPYFIWKLFIATFCIYLIAINYFS